MLSSMNEGIYVVLKLKGMRMPRVLNLYLFGICNILINRTLFVTYLPTRSALPAAQHGNISYTKWLYSLRSIIQA